MSDSIDKLLNIIDDRCNKNLNNKSNNYIKQRIGNVVEYDEDNGRAYVIFPEDENQQMHTYYNKTSETLEEGNQVRVFYTVNIDKGWIGAKCGETTINKLTDKPMYISAKVTNSQAITYDKIERGLISVDFNVDGSDSDVVFTGNQLCDVTTEGDLNCIYKVDGATQDFKPVETFAVGKRVFSHLYPMTLSKGKHNFSIYVISPDGGKGTTGVGEVIGALSGQISGLRNNTLLSGNLVLYFANVPAGTEITLPENMYYYNTDVKKYVDWGDGSEIEESAARSEASHTYKTSGNYTVTIKSDSMRFGASNYQPSFSDNFKTYITRIYFPDEAKEIRWSDSTDAFPNLETVAFGSSATYIVWYFTKSNKITSLFIPDTATYVYFGGMNGTSISHFVVPKNVTTFTHNNVDSLSGISSLTSLEIYSSSIGVGASNCKNLQTLEIGGNAKSVQRYAGCSNLSSVVFTSPSQITSIVNSAFSNCSSLSSIEIPQSVTSIGNYAFENCSSLSSIVIPEKVTSLGYRAFQNCSELSSVRLGSLITQIEDYTFNGCINLNDINFPEGLTKISQYAFQDTGAISSDFPTSLASIGTRAFFNSGITKAVLRSGITCGTRAFYGCKGLASLEIEDGVPSISDYCFYETTALPLVNIPSSVTSIGNYAFRGSGIKSVSFNEGTVNIGIQAFSQSSITSVVLPYSVEAVGEGAFGNCNSLKSVTIKGNKSIDSSAFTSCVSLESVDMGDTYNIPYSCFYHCSNLNSVSFAPDTVVCNSAFAGCGFRTLSLSNIKTTGELSDHAGRYCLGTGAFSGCSFLNSVDGYEYKWDVVEKCAHYNPVYNEKGEIDRYEFSHYTYEIVENGIYNYMSAVDDNVFNNTGLKVASDYPNKKVSTQTEKYYYNDQKSRNPEFPES